MLKFAGRIGLIAGLAVLPHLAFSQQPEHREPTTEEHRRSDVHQSTDQVVPPLAPNAANSGVVREQELSKVIIYRSTCGDTDQHSTADLCEQKKMAIAAREAADFAFFQMWISGAGLVAIGLSLWFTGWAAVAANRAAKAAIDAVGTERAWISLIGHNSGSGKDVTIDGVHHAQAFIIGLNVQNTGRSPALNATLYIESKIVGGGEETPVFSQKLSIDHRKTMIGPGQTGSTPIVAIPWSDVNEIEGGRKKFILYCVARYFTIFDAKTERFSEFCLSVEFNGKISSRDGEEPRPNVGVMAVGTQNSAT